MKIKNILTFVLAGLSILAISSCNKSTSNTTGWKYNDAEYGGYQVVDNYEQDTPPGMVLVQGGTFTVGIFIYSTHSESTTLD